MQERYLPLLMRRRVLLQRTSIKAKGSYKRPAGAAVGDTAAGAAVGDTAAGAAVGDTAAGAAAVGVGDIAVGVGDIVVGGGA